MADPNALDIALSITLPICPYTTLADALPAAGNIEGQGYFWKQRYNKILGKGTVSKYVYKVQQVLKAD